MAGYIFNSGSGGGGSGDVTGPGSATDNAIVRFDGTTGKLVQNSVVLIGDTGNITGVNNITVGGNVIVNGTTDLDSLLISPTTLTSPNGLSIIPDDEGGGSGTYSGLLMRAQKRVSSVLTDVFTLSGFGIPTFDIPAGTANAFSLKSGGTSFISINTVPVTPVMTFGPSGFGVDFDFNGDATFSNIVATAKLNSLDAADTSIAIQGQTFTTTGGHTAIRMEPTWTSSNHNHVGLNLSANQLGNNSEFLIGTLVSYSKQTGATTLGKGVSVAIDSPFIQGTVTESYGLLILDQDDANATSSWAIKTGSGEVQFGDNLTVDGGEFKVVSESPGGSAATYGPYGSVHGLLVNSYQLTGGGYLRYSDFVALGDDSFGIGSTIRFITQGDDNVYEERLRINSAGYIGINNQTPMAQLDIFGDDGSVPAFQITSGSAGDGGASEVYFDFSTTKTLGSGSLTQLPFYINAPTYEFGSADSITIAATFYVSGSPKAGTNATINNSYGLAFDGSAAAADNVVGVGIIQQGIQGGFGNMTSLWGQTIGTGPALSVIGLGNQTATLGDLGSLFLESVTYTSTTLTRTVTGDIATLLIEGAPVESTNVSFNSTAYSLWVQAQTSRFDGPVDCRDQISVIQTINTNAQYLVDNNFFATEVSGLNHILIGTGSGLALTGDSSWNTFIGYNSGAVTTDGSSNVFVGNESGVSNTLGSANVYVGISAGNASIIVSNNTFLGFNSGLLSTGGSNTFVGSGAGDTNTTGVQNTLIGHGSDVGSTGLTNAIAIGYNAVVSASNALILGNGVNVGIGTSSPASASVLDMTSTTKGFLPPRMTTTQRNAITPVEGLIVYDLTIHGLFGYDGTTWIQY